MEITNKYDNIIFGFEGHDKMIFLSEKFLINPHTQKVKIEGEFKCLSDKDTYFYFGIACYNSDRVIYAKDIMRISSAAKIEKLIKEGTFVNKKLLVTCEETDDRALNWNINSNITRESDFTYSLGFYYDGNVNKLPDYVLDHNSNYSHEINYGAIRETDNHSIILNIEIPENIRNQIIEGTTKVIRHTSGGTYLYPAALNYKLNSSWTRKSAEISGIINLGIRDDFKFWTDTESFKVFILCNYNNSSEGSETYAKNVKCEINPI